MATINAQQLATNSARSQRILWETMGDDDEGSAQVIGERPDGSVQVVGTFASATVTLQGSNDGVNWATLTDASGDPVTFTVAGLKMFLPRVWKVRVITSGGSGTDLDVYMLLGS